MLIILLQIILGGLALALLIDVVGRMFKRVDDAHNREDKD